MRLPETYKETLIYKQLEVLDDAESLSKVNQMIKIVTPYLDLIGRDAFDNFTIHHARHSINLMGYASEIIPKETMERLSCVEIMILIYAFYIHDIGMAVSYRDCDAIYKSEDFRVFIETHSEFSDKINDLDKRYQDGVIQPEVDLYKKFLYQTALTDYIRPQHADIKRYKEVVNQILETDPTLFHYKGTSFLDELLLICNSHNCSAIILSEKENGEKRFDPEYMLCGENLNMQFCAAILRICDILDCDQERAPKSFYSAVGIEDKQMPGFKVSVSEWGKQMDIHTININNDYIKVVAKCKNPNIEHAIRELCRDIETEIRATWRELEDNKNEIIEHYKLKLPLIVIPQIKSDKYIYKDYAIKLNDNAIIKLLMGDNLYDSPKVAARELLQNAIDACRVRIGMEGSYTPQIKMTFRKEEDDIWLVVTDNGIGMDEYVLSNYFLKIGNSYYASSEFKSISKKKDFHGFEPISRFGIGFLSVFMIGDVIKVQTRNRYSNYNTKGKVLYLDSTGSLAVVQEDNQVMQGTRVEVKLKKEYSSEEYLHKIVGYVKEVFIRPAVPIDIKLDDIQEVHIENKGFLRLKPSIAAQLEDSHIQTIEVDFSKYSSTIAGYAYFFFYENEDGNLSYCDAHGNNIWDRSDMKSTKLFDKVDYVNLATVNGIKMLVHKVGSIFNYKRKIMPYAIDIDIKSSSQIIFDVARQKIIGQGLDYVRGEIISIVIRALQADGIYDKLSSETQNRFIKARFRYKKREPLNIEYLSKIEKLCPIDDFDVSKPLLRKISEEMELDIIAVRPYVYAVRQMRKN